LANQVLPEDSTGLFKAYLDATKGAHSYLLLDLTLDSEDRHWFRTDLLPAWISSDHLCCGRW